MAAALATGALAGSALATTQPAVASQGLTAGVAKVAVAVLPRGTTVAELARVPGFSLGVMSAGIGSVSSEQTFLDVSQGNRINDELYDRELPGLFPFAREVPGWPDVVARAKAAPADLVPGLLARRLRSGSISSFAEQPMTAAALVAADPQGVVAPLPRGSCIDRCLAVATATVGEVRELSRDLRGGDLLIAIAAQPPDPNEALPIGIAGRGFEGDLTSDSTRTDGYVLSTDLGPTILRRFGLSIPSEMDGDPIRATGAIDPGPVEDLTARMAAIPDRRAPLLIACLGSWLALAVTLALLRPSAGRLAAAWLALAFAFLPLMLLAGAALEPSGLAEGILVGIGAAALAAVTFRLIPGWGGLAIACAITVLGYAIDVVAGSGLTRLSLLGPNPIFGVRFYGIGNELEALIAVMVPVAVGAGLSAYAGWGKEVSRRGAVVAFLGAGLVAALVFAAGRFGADVGAAIVLSIGGVVAAVALPEDFEHFAPNRGFNRSRSSFRLCLLALIVAPFIALLLLALLDVIAGGNSHLTRSVLDPGGAGDLADVAERRLELSAHDFAQAVRNPFFWLVVAGLGVAVARWRLIDAWLGQVAMARAGLIGACAAVAVGVLVNDSGASFLALGALALGACLAFAWAERPPGG